MLEKIMHGFYMALADSVPGVSGGTIAFIMGFYDQLINSIHNLIFGEKSRKKSALTYLGTLGIGWLLGMTLAVLILSALFKSHIYLVSSLFIGFVLGAIPIIVKEEKQCLRGNYYHLIFLWLGIAVVTGITYMNGKVGTGTFDLGAFSPVTSVQLFCIGALAISAMFLPGISGSTLLLIFGAYIPVINALKEILHLRLNYVPAMAFFVAGILCGTVTVVKLIRLCLKKYRAQTVYCVLGMMIGSLYAIIMGPTTFGVAQPALNPANFNIAACLVGLALVLGMQLVKEKGSTGQ